MNSNRLKQILSSPAEIEVRYQGASVWIDQLNEDGTTVTVHLKGSHDQKTSVAISDLEEA